MKVIGERNSTFSKDLVLISFSNIDSKEGISVKAIVRLFIPLFHFPQNLHMKTFLYGRVPPELVQIVTGSIPVLAKTFLLAPFNLC